MTQQEIIKQLVIDNLQPYNDWTIKVVQDKLMELGIYVTNTEVLGVINEVSLPVEETPNTEA